MSGHRWLPIVDLTTTEPWEALGFARNGKPIAETAIKLVSDQNYQRTERAPVGGTVKLHRMEKAGFETAKAAKVCKFVERDLQHGH